MPSRSTPVLVVAALAVSSGLFGCQAPASPAAVLVADEYGITGIAVDDFNVYFTKKDGTLKSVPIDGGAVRELSYGIVDPIQIAHDADDLFIRTSTGQIARVPKGGGNLVPLVEGGPDIQELTLDPADLYFSSGNTRSIQRLSKAAGAAGTDEGEAPEVLVEDADGPGPLVYQGGDVYFGVGSASGAVRRVSVGGGNVYPVVEKSGKVTDVFADGSFVAWATSATPGADDDEPSGAVTLARPDGSDPRPIATGQTGLFQVLHDESHVYWSSTTGDISAAPVDGNSAPFVLSSGPQGPLFLAQDALFLYSARFEAGTILVRPKTEDATFE